MAHGQGTHRGRAQVSGRTRRKSHCSMARVYSLRCHPPSEQMCPNNREKAANTEARQMACCAPAQSFCWHVESRCVVEGQPVAVGIKLSLRGFKVFRCCGQCLPSIHPQAVALAARVGGCTAASAAPSSRAEGSRELRCCRSAVRSSSPGPLAGTCPLVCLGRAMRPPALLGQRGTSSLSK